MRSSKNKKNHFDLPVSVIICLLRISRILPSRLSPAQCQDQSCASTLRPWPAFVVVAPPRHIHLACDCSRCHYTSLIDTFGLSRTVRCFRGLSVPQNNFARFPVVIFHTRFCESVVTLFYISLPFFRY